MEVTDFLGQNLGSFVKKSEASFFFNIIFDKEHRKQKLGESFVMLIHIRVAAESFVVLFFKKNSVIPSAIYNLRLLQLWIRSQRQQNFRQKEHDVWSSCAPK